MEAIKTKIIKPTPTYIYSSYICHSNFWGCFCGGLSKKTIVNMCFEKRYHERQVKQKTNLKTLYGWNDLKQKKTGKTDEK